MKDHLANMAAIDKATDEERARRVMALEMRLAERRALARQKVSHGHLSYAWNILIASFNEGMEGGEVLYCSNVFACQNTLHLRLLWNEIRRYCQESGLGPNLL